jgi:hypothetical protein
MRFMLTLLILAAGGRDFPLAVPPPGPDKGKQSATDRIERLRTDVRSRCQRLLALQFRVWDGTHVLINQLAEPGKKLTRAQAEYAAQVAGAQADIVRQAAELSLLVRGENSGNGLPEVCAQIRDDMQTVQRRLEREDLGVVTVKIERDIIEMLQEMIEALKPRPRPKEAPTPKK